MPIFQYVNGMLTDAISKLTYAELEAQLTAAGSYILKDPQ